MKTIQGGIDVFVLVKHFGKSVRRTVAVTLCAACGCGGFDLRDLNPSRSTLSSAIYEAGAQSPFYETGPNNFLPSAELVDVNEQPRMIYGRIEGSLDVDVFDLGPVQPGDRIVVEMTPDESLDGAIALFDDTGAALLINDHRNVYLGRSQPFVEVVIRRPGDACYVVAAATPGYNAWGDYTLLAYKADGTIPASRSDTILLVFSGGNGVTIGSRAPINVSPFDAADIDAKFTGQTGTLIRQIVSKVRADYAGLDIDILSTSEGARFENPMSRLFFGSFDAALLGVAEGVDEFNAARSQEAIVFTDTFEAFIRIQPTVTEMGQAIANVASHEIGHLMGLVHTKDAAGVMDVTASLNQLLEDQAFRRSALYSEVFPIGAQDAVQLLLDSLGGDLLLTLSKYVDGSLAKAYKREPDGPPARSLYYLSSCGLEEE